MKPVILVDASCDLPSSYIEEKHIPHIGLMCHIDEEEFEDDFGKSLTYDEFYSELRRGKMPTTSQINSYRFEERFRAYAEAGVPVIYLAMSSGLSGTYSSAVIAREAVMEQYPQADITVIDTKSASVGEGLLVWYAYDMLDKGATKEEIVNWVEENKMRMNHWFMVEDLNHLKKGGRISASKAAIGSLLSIKPIIYIIEDGTLSNVTNVRGRKKGLRFLIDQLRERAVGLDQQVVAISHGDCQEDAELLEKVIREEFDVKDVIINKLGLIMGSHCGQGMMSLCFLGNDRKLD